MSRGFGVTAGLYPEIASPLAGRCQELGYTSMWSNDHPGAKGLETLAAYLAFRARRFPAPDDSGASVPKLIEMIRRNADLALGPRAVLAARQHVQPMWQRRSMVR